jgi:hypothetical protein
MGGNALKHLHPVRLTSAEVVELVHHLHRNWQLIDAPPLYLVPWVAEKQDHGDIDLICVAEPETVRRFVAGLGVTVAAIRTNDRVLSVPMPLPWATDGRLAQVDFICCAATEARAMRFFYAGGDFGMLLGRVAAWHGLLFGMDGLRYRAERDVPWAADVPLTSEPSEVLAALGYPPTLPWFDTYDRMWRYVLSGPLAGPWMFLPEATNNENRSRDRQRRKINDFQAWLAEHFPDQMTPPAPRRTPAEARAWVRAHFPAVGIDDVLRRQEAGFTLAKLRTRLLGLGAVEDVLGPGQSPELLGAIVRDMQPLLPERAVRAAAMADADGWCAQIAAARVAAATVAAARGLATQAPPPIPAFVPSL